MKPLLPVKEFRLGRVTAHVFDKNSGDKPGSNYSISVQKEYIEAGKSKLTTSFNLVDLPLVSRVIFYAERYIKLEADIDQD